MQNETGNNFNGVFLLIFYLVFLVSSLYKDKIVPIKKISHKL